MDKPRLFRHDNGTASLAVLRNENLHKVQTGVGFSATVTQVQGKLHQEVTVTTAKNAVALMTTVVITDGDKVEKRITTVPNPRKYGDQVTRVDVFAATSSGKVERTSEWNYRNGAKVTARYGDGVRVMEVGGGGLARDEIKTTGRSDLGKVDAVTQSASGLSSTLPGGVVIGPGNMNGYYDPNRQGDSFDVTNVDGSRRSGIETSGNDGGVETTSSRYDVFSPDGTRTGQGRSTTYYDPQTGVSSGKSFEWDDKGNMSGSSAETDGHGGMTTFTSVTEKNDDGSTTTYESTYTTNADGSSSRTTTTTSADGSKSVETVNTDKDGNSTVKTDTYNTDGEKTDSSSSGGDEKPTDNPDKSTSLYPNPDGTDGPPNPAWRGPADSVFTEYLEGLNGWLGGNVLSQGVFSDREYTPPIFSIENAMKSQVTTKGGRELASGVAVLDKDDVNLSSIGLVGSLEKLAVLSPLNGGLTAAKYAAGLIKN